MNRFTRALTRHPMIEAYLSLKGNARVSINTEPLIGIPGTLYSPFVALYMYAIGLDYAQIGLIVSVTMVCQVVTSFISGILVDKLGRRYGLLVAGILCWIVPTLLWAFAQSFTWFLIAAIFNSFNQMLYTAFILLIGEDTEPDKLVHFYSWLMIAGFFAVLFSPLSALMVGSWGLVAAVRALYLFAFVCVTLKFILVHIFSHETEQGKKRKEELRGKPIFSFLRGYGPVIRKLLRTPRTLFILCLMVLSNIAATVSGAYGAIFATQRLGMPEEWFAYLPMVSSLMTVLFIFTIQHRITRTHYRLPMLIALGLWVTGISLLLSGVYIGLVGFFANIVCATFANAIFMPLRESLVVRFIDPEERARITSMLMTTTLLIAAPFGYIGGLLFRTDNMFPFLASICLYVVAALVLIFVRPEKMEADAQTAR